MKHHVLRGLLLGSLLCSLSLQAHANLCDKSVITQRHRDEAVLMKTRDFAPASPDYQGGDDYNAWVLACNRTRDNRGNEVEDKVSAKTGGNFAANLQTVSVRGQYSFYGESLATNLFTSLEYRYFLRRENGEWIVTLPIKFDIPEVLAYNTDKDGKVTTAAISNRFDIPKHLAVKLGLMSSGSSGSLMCDPGQEKMVTVHTGNTSTQMVDTGFFGPSDSYDGPACRLDTNLAVSGGKLKAAYFEYWKGGIAAAWSRTGFRVEALVLDHDNISDAMLKNIKRDDMIWNLHMTFDASQRPRFRSGFLSLRHIYVGAYADTFVHEAGHELGLDDEYRENNNGGKNAWRDCSDAAMSPNGAHYLMCRATYAGTESDNSSYWNSAFGIVRAYATKGVYPWIITRRYVVGEKEQCFAESDCSSKQYCDTGVVLGIGRNQCEPLVVENDNCSADKQCISPAICKGKPLGKCITESSVALGGSCSKDVQCNSGSCDNTGTCQCTSDAQCGSNAHCNKGVLGIGRNVCVSDTKLGLKANCQRNEQCASGSCSGNGHCQCTKDAHCSGSQECKTPIFKENFCQ